MKIHNPDPDTYKKNQTPDLRNCKIYHCLFKLAYEAAACEEKEEKLVTDAVKHLTEANTQIKDLHSQFTNKVSP